MTNLHWKTAVLAFAATLTAAPASAAEINLIGTFELLSASVHYLDTGEIVPDIYGKTAEGFIIYGADGQMLALLTNSNRPKPESIQKTTDEQRIALYKTMQAYGGTYTFDGKTVSHNVDICWDEVRCGTVVVRDIEQDGGQAHLQNAPGSLFANGRMAVVSLVWRKMK